MRTRLLLNLFHERLSGLERGNFVFGDDNSSVLGNVASGLFRTCFNDEAAEATEINVFAVDQRVFNNFHELLNSFKNVRTVNAGGLSNFAI